MFKPKHWVPDDKMTDMELNRMESGIEKAQNYVKSEKTNKTYETTFKSRDGHLVMNVEEVK